MNTLTTIGATALTVALAASGSGAVHHPPPSQASPHSCWFNAVIPAQNGTETTVVVRWDNVAGSVSCRSLVSTLSDQLVTWHLGSVPAAKFRVCRLKVGGWRYTVWQADRYSGIGDGVCSAIDPN
jgi:hypothetical protein